jgi:hypothetical protein
MAFNNFKSIGTVARQFRIRIEEKNFIDESILLTPREEFRNRLDFVLQHRLHEPSEAARCETLIYPILTEIWQSYVTTLRLWSHAPLEFDAMLSGVPDYIIAAQSELGSAVFGDPILVTVEAKRDDFDLGWGQCAAEMLAAQKLNGERTNVHIFGIVTNGITWEFGCLFGSTLTREIAVYSISKVGDLFGALSFIMEECAKQVRTVHSQHLEKN